jgi:lipoprotein-anchoring transpeptidase ErfK/SrfK
MRRSTLGLAGLALVVAAGTGVAAQGLAPAHSRSAAIKVVPAAAPAAQNPGVPTDQAATLVGTVGTAVPASSQLATPRSAAGLVYWFDPKQPVIGQLGSTNGWGLPTVLPVVSAQGSWLQVRLPSRPNGSTAWVRREDVSVTTTTYRIAISVSQRTLTLYQNGQAIYSAPVGVGRSQWPTPLGPSFVVALVPVPARQQFIYGPVVIMTGSHSDVFATFDGGDGIVGIHGYPSDPKSTAGVASSHGCIRVSPGTLTAIGQVPAGTSIDINP